MTISSLAPTLAVEEVRSAGTLTLTAMCTAALVAFLAQFALSPFMPAIAQSLAVDVALLGQIPALMMLLAAALGLVAGPLADAFGHRRLLLLGMGAAAGSAAATALAPGYAFFLLVAILGSGGRAIVQPVLMAIASTRFHGAARRRALSWTLAALSGSTIVGLPVLTAVEAHYGWRAAFVLLALIGFAVVPLLAATLAPDGARSERLHLGSVLRAYVPILRHRPTLGLITAAFLRNTLTWALHTYLGAFLVSQHAMTTQGVGWVYVVVGIGFMSGSLAAAGRLGNVSPWIVLAVVGPLAGALQMAILLAPLDATGVTALTGASVILLGFANAVSASLLGTVSPAGAATTMTLNQSAFSVGTAVGSSLGGVALAAAGYGALAWIILVAAVLSSLAVWMVRPS